MADEFILRSVDIDKDAEALARMWNESDDQWPGSWTGGVPMTAERMKRWYQEEDVLDVLIWANDAGVIAGYCSMQKFIEEEGVAYIALLNVHPGYQKQSLGRKVLQEYIQRSIKLGFKRLDLHTWSGNLKSVPLYKKTGFFWMPDGGVHLFNFLPTILQMPCARPYFDKHDWYKTFVRKLEQHDDDEHWRGMKVFTYQWESGDDRLTIWVDREARAVTAIETNDLFAAAIPESIAPPKGVETQMRWELRNNSAAPMTVSLIAHGTEHLKLDYRDNLTLAPDESVTKSAAVMVESKAPRIQKRHPAPALQSLLLLNGQLLELGTGLRPEPALVVETLPKRFIIAPGVERTVHLQLRNELDAPVKAQVNLVAPAGVSVSRMSAELELPPYGRSGFPLTLCAAAADFYTIQALVSFTINGRPGQAAPQELPVAALYPGQVMAQEDEEGVRVNTAQGCYEVRREGGMLSLMRPEGDQWLGGIGSEFGPPYDPPEFRYKPAQVSWRRAPSGEIIVEARLASARFPGLEMVREAHFAGGPLIRIVYRALNQSDKNYELEMNQYLERRWEDEYRLFAPLRSRLLEASTRGFPRGDDELPKKSEDWGEKWFAFQGDQSSIGLIWNQDFDELRYEWGVALHRARFSCPPHSWAAPCESWIYCGAGDWRDVQRAYLLLSGRAASALAQPEPLVHLGFADGLPLAQSSTLPVTFTLENRRQQKLSGRIQLSAPQGWRVEPATLDCADVDRWHPFSAKVVLRQQNETPGGYALRAQFSTALNETRYELPFLRLGNGAAVKVYPGEQDGQAIYTLDNGLTRFVVAPGFSGALIGWFTADGVNHIETPFPRVGAKGYFAPWYGGLMPMLRSVEDREAPGKLYQESIQAQPVEIKDERGLTWQGVRLSVELQREALRGLRLQIEYLTVGGSPVLKTVYRLLNKTDAVRKARGNWMTFWAPDGAFAENVLHAEGWESKRTDFMDAWMCVGHWASVTNPATGRTAIAVSPQPIITLVDEGRHMASINIEEELVAPPQGELARVVYHALAPDLDSARAYICLKDRR